MRNTICLNLFVFLPGLGISMLIAFLLGPQSYSIWDNYISDLGSISITPVPILFDSIAMLGALLMIPAFFYNFKFLTEGSSSIIFNSEEKLLRRILNMIVYFNSLIGLIFLLIGSIGLFGVGVFSLDRPTQFNLHFISSILIFVGITFGAFFQGIAIMLKRAICPRFLGLYMIFGPFLAGYLFLNPMIMLPEPFLEWLILFAQQVWLMPAAFYTLNHIKKANTSKNSSFSPLIFKFKKLINCL